MVSAREIRSLLDERPELEPVLDTALSADEPWTFDDFEIDSGTFGEFVSQEFVEAASENGYRLVDEQAARAALREEFDTGSSSDPESRQTSKETAQIRAPQIGGTGVALVGLAFSILLGFRLPSLGAVYRDGVVILSSNDPYLYRFLVERIMADPAVSLGNLPTVVQKGEPLFVATMWLVTELLGGTPTMAGHALAWYPVVSALVTGLLVYLVALRLTDDHRVAIASVLILAVLPGHAVRTSLGFADHHAFDYPWLALTLLGLVVVTQTPQQRLRRHVRDNLRSILFITVGITGNVLAWEAGPLLIVPVGLVAVFVSLRAVSHETSPLVVGAPIIIGSALAACLTWGAHTVLEWHTTLVASAPVLLTVGSLTVLLVGELWHRRGLSVRSLGAVEGVGAIAGLGLVRFIAPEYWSRAMTAVTERLLARRAIREVSSLFTNPEQWFLLFGLVLLFALPYMAYGTYRARIDGRWLPAVVYGWYFLALSAIQARFVGEFSAVLAVFGGFGLIHLASWVDLIRPPAVLTGSSITSVRRPDAYQALSIGFVFLLVTSLSIALTPIVIGQTTVPDGQYETATEIAAYSDDHDLSYPENYVLSNWGDSRMYNSVVNGESQSYSYARSNYAQFARATDGQQWYQRLQGRAGFVVTTDRTVSENPRALGTRLHTAYGTRTQAAPGVANYRLIGVADDGEYKAFALVPGAVLNGTATPNERVTVQREVTVDGVSFQYVRQTTADGSGRYTVRVPYPGTYQVANRTVTVSESAVINGSTVSVTAS
jgi:dolichyl-diphosphooligosaccharide--protein glycosyltransferase